MFREMRRNDKLKSVEETVAILKEGSSGVMSVLGDDGYPYGVPVNYVYEDGKIFIHCATAGHKLDAIRKEPKVSFTVIGADILNQEKITTIYKSVVCFGKAREAMNDDEKLAIIDTVLERFGCNGPAGKEYTEKVFENFSVIVIDIEHMTGKGLAK